MSKYTSGKTEVTFYVQLVPEFYYDGSDVRSVKLANATQGKPTRPVAKAKVVKVKLRVPDAAFMEEQMTAVIDVPLENISNNGVEGESLPA